MLRWCFIVVALGGCTLVDAPLPDRTYGINIGSGNLRENVVLLNIVRASRFEPLNFVILSKYTGSGSLGGGVTATRNMGLVYDLLNNGAAITGKTSTSAFPQSVVVPNANVNTGASFDLAPLENKEFYGGFLAQIDLTQVNLLLNAGLSRELVLNSIVKSARVTHANGSVYEYYNDPSNDAWGSEKLSDQCQEIPDVTQVPFGHPIWLGEHAHDCNYQKFQYFMRAAVNYGMTTETHEVPNPAAKTDKAAPATIHKVNICYDSAIAQQHDKKVTALGACGSKSLTQGFRTYADFGPHVKLIQPVLRSPYAVFQYFGRLLATNTAKRVKLFDAGSPRMPTNDRLILSVVTGGTDCFAQANLANQSYCVPSQGANNTKEVFVLLSALVNLSTTRSALPTTPTVINAP